MKHLLINPPCYSYIIEASAEYSLALMRLSTYLKSMGDEVELFDFLPYKPFFISTLDINSGPEFKKIYADNVDDGDVKCYKSQRLAMHPMSFTRKTGEYVTKLDKYFQRLYSGADKSVFIDYLINNKPDKIWISSGITYYYRGTVEVIDWCKEIYPDVPVVLGGIYPTLCYDHAIKNTKADKIIRGDFKEIENIDCDFSILANKPTYLLRQFSRGCPNKCKFCSVSYIDGTRIRHVDIDKDMAEISRFSDTYNNNNMKLWGSNVLLINKGKTFSEWLDKLIAMDRDWKISCPEGFAPELLTVDLCRKIKEAGFLYIQIPIESAGLESLSTMNKKYNIDTWKRAIDYAFKAGFNGNQIHAAVICGYDGQTEQDLSMTMDLIESMGISSNYRAFTPVPMSEWYESNGRYKNTDLEYLNGLLFPAADTIDKFNLFSRYGEILRRGYSEKEETEMDKDIIKKMATLLLDISQQNETLIASVNNMVSINKDLVNRVTELERKVDANCECVR